MTRKWREAIGAEKIMIGHGGGFLVGSDMVEGYDACLTGEAQVKLDPSTVGQQFGTAPTLWTLQRRKKDIFQSHGTIEQLIECGVTPHVGVGVTGTAVEATLDPAHHVALMALWQMWRAFPVQNAVFYNNALTPGYLDLDNEEVAYSLYATPAKQLLLILVNKGGERLDDSPAIGVNVKLNTTKLELPKNMNAWRLKGNTYETFRVQKINPVVNGEIVVHELDHHEFIGFILSANDAPNELNDLERHLASRGERLGELYARKNERLKKMDQQMDYFSTLNNASVYFSYNAFMNNRVVE
jgi:hypothetical protein